MNIVQKSLTVALVAVTSFLLLSCGKSGGQNGGPNVQPVDVRIEIVKPQRLVDGIVVAGTVKAYEDVNLSPEEGGVVKEWKAKKGQRVSKGDLIVVLKDEVIKAGYDAAEAQYKMAELTLEKQQKVFDQQGISELQIKNLQYTRDAAKANADLMKARWERTQLRSPIDGIVDNTLPNEGDMAPPGVPLARIVNSTQIKIQADVPELYSGYYYVRRTSKGHDPRKSHVCRIYCFERQPSVAGRDHRFESRPASEARDGRESPSRS